MANPRRVELNNILKEVLGSENVYFQPPKDQVMQYPCIVYNRDDADSHYADNIPYTVCQGYEVTLIDPNPDSDVIAKLQALPTSKHNRHFATSGLNHDVFVIYH